MPEFLTGFFTILGFAAGLLLVALLFWLVDTAINFVMRYSQSGWYPDEVGQHFGPRARWALNMTFTGPRLPWSHR